MSIPWHRDGIHIWSGILTEGTTMLLMAGNGMGANWKGRYPPDLADFLARSMAERAGQLLDSAVAAVLLGQYLHESHHGRYYALAQNLAPPLRVAYDYELTRCDVLVMPTTPMTATPLPTPTRPARNASPERVTWEPTPPRST